MLKIIKILLNRFNIKIQVHKEFISIHIVDKEKICLSVIYCNLNIERTTYSYIDYRKIGKRTEHRVSKDKLFEFIADLILYPKTEYKRIDNF